MTLDRRLIGSIALLFSSLFLFTACGGVANPEGWASPVFDGDQAYLFQEKDRLTALNGDGSTRWRFPDDNKEEQKDIDLRAVYGTPTVLDGAIYFATYEGEAFALNTDTGSVIWTRELDSAVVGAPALSDTRYAVGTTEGRVYVLDRQTGSPVEPWPADGLPLSDGIWAPVLVDGDNLFVATMDGLVRRFSLTSSEETWGAPFKAEGAIADLALLGDAQLYAPSLDKHAYVIDKDSGNQLQVLDFEHWVWSKPAEGPDGLIIATDVTGHVSAYDPSTGEARWTYDAGSRVKSSPVTIGDVVIIADRKPVVHFISATSGEQLNTVPVPDKGTFRADPVIKDDSAYLLTHKGNLFKADPAVRSVVEQLVGRFRQ